MAFDLDDQELAFTRKLHGIKEFKKEDMKLPTSKKKVTLKDVSLGTAYDINKNLVKKYEKELTQEQLKEKEELIDNFTRARADHYYMMLCHDRRDYTIFHTDCTSGRISGEFMECLQNRGKIVAIDETENADAIEIWLMIQTDFEKEEAFCYYFFPYESAVVEY